MKSNWDGGSGWGTIDDPTSSLNGRVLVASAGLSQESVDYLLQVVGTSTAFSESHYSVKADYAYVSNSNISSVGIGLIARASSITAGIAASEYRAIADNSLSQLRIEKKVNGVTSTLATATVPSSTFSSGSLHTLEFKCYGTDQVALQFLIDDAIAINAGDTSSTKLSSGFAGLISKSGTSYVDNFAIQVYSSTGEAVGSWTPSNIGSDLRLWLKSDTGVTTATGVSAWADQSGNSNDAAQGTGSKQPAIKSADIGGFDALKFDGTDDFLTITDAASLDLSGSGCSIVVIMQPSSMGTVTGSQTLGPVLRKNTNYFLRTRSETSPSTYTNRLDLLDEVNSSDNFVDTSNYGIYISITDSASAGTTQGFWKNGTQNSTTTATMAGTNANNLTIGTNDDASPTLFFSGVIAEVMLLNGELDTATRQKVEGYIAHRYGITVLLPSDHPYRYNAPLVS